jgi:hypothetical protein
MTGVFSGEERRIISSLLSIHLRFPLVFLLQL